MGKRLGPGAVRPGGFGPPLCAREARDSTESGGGPRGGRDADRTETTGGRMRREGIGRATALVALLGLAGLAACGGGEESDAPASASAGSQARAQSQATGPSPEVMAQLDSGTVAYRQQRLEDARRHYRAAVELNPHSASAWFGVHMAEKALGDTVAADSAMERARQLSPGSVPESHGEGDGSVYDHVPSVEGSSAASGPDEAGAG